MEKAKKVDTAPLEQLPVSSSKIELVELSDKELKQYRDLREQEGSGLDVEEEEELYQELLQVLAEAVNEVLPGFVSIFVRKKWIKKIAKLLFAWLIKKLIKLLQ